MSFDRIFAVLSSQRIILFLSISGFLVLLLGISYPLLGAGVSRDVPVELDDSAAYIQRGVQMATCPRQDCPALEDLRPVFETPSSDPGIAFLRRDMFTRTLQNHIPLYSYVMSLFYRDGDGVKFFRAYYALQGLTALLLATAIAVYFRGQFGPVPASIAAVLVAATYFAGQGLISLVPVTLGWAFVLLGIALLMQMGNRALPFLVVISFMAIGSHVIGKVYVVLLLAFYVLRGDRPQKAQDWANLILIAGSALMAFILPQLIDRPSLGNPAAANVHANLLEEIKESILKAPQITERSTLMVGGLLPMLAISLVTGIHLSGRMRRDFFVLFGLFGSLACVSLFYVHSHYPADLFARTWIPLAILMTGACAYLFCTLIRSVMTIGKGLAPNTLFPRDAISILAPRGWAQLALILATLMLTAGFSYHLAKGGYAIIRAKIMLMNRHDFTFTNRQIDTVTRDCDKILYMHKDAMLTYFATGALKCGAIYFPVFEPDEWRKDLPRIAPHISYTVTMNQMAQWKGWQPIGIANPAKLSFWRTNVGHALRMRIKNAGGPATITLRSGQNEISRSIPPHATTWIRFDADKIDDRATYDIVTSTGQLALGGIRLDDVSDLYWPWDQGVTLSYHRAIPYQFTADITFRFDTHEIFPPDIGFAVVDDHSATVLAKRR